MRIALIIARIGDMDELRFFNLTFLLLLFKQSFESIPSAEMFPVVLHQRCLIDHR